MSMKRQFIGSPPLFDEDNWPRTGGGQGNETMATSLRLFASAAGKGAGAKTIRDFGQRFPQQST